VFPNEKRELSAGCTEDRGRACGLHKKAIRQAAEKARLFLQPSLMCNPAARLNVQPAGPSCSAAYRTALLCSSPAHGKFMFFIWQHSPPARPARRLVFSILHKEMSKTCTCWCMYTVSTIHWVHYKLANVIAWCPFCDVGHATIGLTLPT